MHWTAPWVCLQERMGRTRDANPAIAELKERMAVGEMGVVLAEDKGSLLHAAQVRVAEATCESKAHEAWSSQDVMCQLLQRLCQILCRRLRASRSSADVGGRREGAAVHDRAALSGAQGAHLDFARWHITRQTWRHQTPSEQQPCCCRSGWGPRRCASLPREWTPVEWTRRGRKYGH